MEFVSSDEIAFSTTGNTVKAGIKSGSIAEDKLNPALFSRLDTAVSAAESSAANAQTYAQKAQTQATNAVGSAVDAGIDAHNAETWTEGGQLMSEGGTLLPEHTTGAKEYAQMAQTSAGQAASSAANADTSKNAAAESAQRAEEAAKQAEEIAGGDFVTRSEFSLHTGDQEEHVTKEERTAWNAKLDEAKRGKAGGVASLDAQGKVPAGQLPEMNYDPAGSAQAVQQALNTHAANKTVHVTDAERQSWNSKAAGNHTHTAQQVGALPLSGGDMKGQIRMGGRFIRGLAKPVEGQDAANKDYVDSVAAKKGWTELERITVSKTWTVPEGVTRIGVFLMGGGQSGEGKPLSTGSGSSEEGSAEGGASGWGKSVILNVTPGQKIQAVIGSGGVCVEEAKGTGGDTKFGNYIALGGGHIRCAAAGVQDVGRFDTNAASAYDQQTNFPTVPLESPYGGISSLVAIEFDDYGTREGVISWISDAVEADKNLFDPTMRAFGLGGCVSVAFNDSDTNANDAILLQTKAADLGDMGRAGEAQVHWLDSSSESGTIYKGGDASGYGNGGGACVSCSTARRNDSTTLGGNGSPGIIIIYV